MNIFTKFRKILQDYGLQYFGIYHGVYRATVVDNNDPEHLGRLKINVPQFYNGVIPDKWVFARGMMAGKGFGVFWVPQPGDPIYVSFENGDVRFPLWEYGWYTQGNSPERAQKENASTFLFQSPKGQKIILDDDKELVRIEDVSGQVLELGKSKIFLGNSQVDLYTLIDKIVSAAENTKTSTQLGPQPFINVAEWSAIRLELEKGFKNTDDGSE